MHNPYHKRPEVYVRSGRSPTLPTRFIEPLTSSTSKKSSIEPTENDLANTNTVSGNGLHVHVHSDSRSNTGSRSAPTHLVSDNGGPGGEAVDSDDEGPLSKKRKAQWYSEGVGTEHCPAVVR
jgi:hypothetical protein